MSSLEKHNQPNKYHDFFYCILFNALVVTLCSWVIELHAFPGDMLAFSIITIICMKYYPTEIVRFMFGIKVKSIE
jgi:hypothetical protein